jgi:hypothetical protein
MPRRLRFGPRPFLSFPAPNGGNSLRDRNFESSFGPRTVIEIRDRNPRQSLSDSFLDRAQIIFFIGRDERKGFTDFPRARCASNAVDVVVGGLRDIEIDHVTERLDVDSASRDIGRDEYAILASLESGERGGALPLRPVTVDALGTDAPLYELLG